MSKQTLVIVDPYSTSRMLPRELEHYGISCASVRSVGTVPPFFRSHFDPGLFRANIIHEGTIDVTMSKLRGFEPVAILPGCEMGVPLADELGERLHLPGNDTDFSAARCDKYVLATTLADAGLRAIPQLTSCSASEIESWMIHNRFAEIVVKPRDSAGTDGVFFCRTGADIVRAVESVVGRRNLFDRINEVAIAQERVHGSQFTVNTVSIDGEHYVGEIWTYETLEVDGSSSVCAVERLLDGRDEIADLLGCYVGSALDALRIRQGPTHVEVIVNERGPVVVDLGARLQGSMSYRARLRALGHNHVTLTALRFADPERFRAYASGNSPYRRVEHAYCVSLVSGETGVVTSHAGFGKVKSLDTFCDSVALAPVGCVLEPTRDLASTPGIVYLVSADEDALRRDYDRIRALSMAELFDLQSV